ncbi:unnamed protein product [Calypogeia fissa]
MKSVGAFTMKTALNRWTLKKRKHRKKQLYLMLTRWKVPVKRRPESLSRIMPLRASFSCSICEQRVDPLQMLLLKEDLG